MSKGKRPTIKNRPDVLTVETSKEIEDTETNCWTFPLEECTPHAYLASIGTAVSGTIFENRILVRGGSHDLGYLPDSLALQIIGIATGKRGRLTGRVVAQQYPSAISAENDVWVTICLI